MCFRFALLIICDVELQVPPSVRGERILQRCLGCQEVEITGDRLITIAAFEK